MEGLIQNLRASFAAIASTTLAGSEAEAEQSVVDKMLEETHEKLILIANRGKGLEDKAAEALQRQQLQRAEEDAKAKAAAKEAETAARTKLGDAQPSPTPRARGHPPAALQTSPYGPARGTSRKRVEHQSIKEMLKPSKSSCLERLEGDEAMAA